MCETKVMTQLPGHVIDKISTDSMLLPSTEMLFGAEPEPRFCSLVLAHEILKPSGAAASVKVDSLALHALRRSIYSWHW